jgi:hypothetical protein
MYSLAAAGPAVGRNKEPLALHVGGLDPEQGRLDREHPGLEVFGVGSLAFARHAERQKLCGFSEGILERHRRDEDLAPLVDVQSMSPGAFFVIFKAFALKAIDIIGTAL